MKSVLVPFGIGIVLLLSGGLIGAQKPVATTNSPAGGPRTASDEIYVRIGTNSFSVLELKKRSLQYILDSGGTIEADKSTLTVVVTPRDPDGMCTVSLWQGFGRLNWSIIFGYDGQIKSHSKHVPLCGTGMMMPLGRP